MTLSDLIYALGQKDKEDFNELQYKTAKELAAAIYEVQPKIKIRFKSYSNTLKNKLEQDMYEIYIQSFNQE